MLSIAKLKEIADIGIRTGFASDISRHFKEILCFRISCVGCDWQDSRNHDDGEKHADDSFFHASSSLWGRFHVILQFNGITCRKDYQQKIIANPLFSLLLVYYLKMYFQKGLSQMEEQKEKNKGAEIKPPTSTSLLF
jgi:hypothetical protein